MTVENAISAIAALLVVLALLGLGFMALRRFNLMPGMPMAAMTPKQRRLKVVESLALDSRRRVVLIRQDDKEHLILLGINDDRPIATGMEAPAEAALEAPAAQQPPVALPRLNFRRKA